MSDYNPYQWKYYQKDHNKYLAYHRAKSKERYWENKVTCPWCGRGVELPDLIHPRCAEAKRRTWEGVFGDE